jgi:hypothetical protein
MTKAAEGTGGELPYLKPMKHHGKPRRCRRAALPSTMT